MSKGVKTPRNLLCEIGPLNGDREEKNTPFSGETSTTPFDAVYLKTDPFRRLFWTRVRSKSYGEWPPPGQETSNHNQLLAVIKLNIFDCLKIYSEGEKSNKVDFIWQSRTRKIEIYVV